MDTGGMSVVSPLYPSTYACPLCMFKLTNVVGRKAEWSLIAWVANSGGPTCSLNHTF